MAEIGLFPLGIVLLPTEQVPLHIFEDRYQELIGECLEDEREFGLVYADDDGLRPIGTRAAVTEVMERFDDGRMNVVIEGRARFRLVELTQGRSFHTGEVEPLEDQDDPARPEDVEQALGLFRRLVELTGAEVEEPEGGQTQLSFALAARFDFAADLKQELLQETSERIRVERLCRLLSAAAEAVERQQEIAARAQGNGRVTPRTPPTDDAGA
jgi:Lon protease-like protein